MRIASGVTDQYIYFVAVDATDLKTRETGLSSFTVYRSRNGGAAAAMTTPTINEVDSANMPGVYELLLDEDMTIDAGDDTQEMVFHITHAGMAPVTRAIELYRPKITLGYTLGTASDGDLLEVNTLTGHTAQTGDSFTRIGATGSGLTSLAQASVLGALTDAAASGDPTTADTVMQYIKQLINILIGTAGIATFPAEAAPADAVSLAEVIRAIHADVTGLNGDAMRGTDNAALAATALTNATWTDARAGYLDELAAANIPADIDSITAKLPSKSYLAGSADADGGIDATEAAVINAEADTALSDYDPPTYDELEGFIQLLARSDAAIETDRATLLTAINADEGSGAGDYSAQSDSQEAIRDRGDAAWTTGAGGSLNEILNIQPLVPNEIDLANTAVWRLGIMLIDSYDDLPTTAEITPGTIDIDRKAIGDTSWTSVVSGAACSEAAGLIYYDEVFDAGTGYAEGDSIRVTFKSQSITASGNTYEISDATGRIFYTSIRQTMRGTDNAALAATALTNATWTDARAGYLDELAAANMPADLDAVLADTNELQTDDVPGLIAALNDPSAAAVADAVWDELSTGHTDAGKAGAQVWTDIDAILADTNELQTDDYPTSLAAIEADTQDIQSRLPAALVSGRMSSDAVALSGSTAAADALEAAALTVPLLTVNDANTTPTTTLIPATGITEATADHFIGRIVIFVTGALKYQATDITDYVWDATNSELNLTVSALTEAPSDGDTFVIV